MEHGDLLLVTKCALAKSADLVLLGGRAEEGIRARGASGCAGGHGIAARERSELTVRERVDTTLSDDSFVIFVRECDFVERLGEHLVKVAPDNVHLPHLGLTLEEAPLVVSKGDRLLHHSLRDSLALLLLLSRVHPELVQGCTSFREEAQRGRCES